jgi:hypothetical protein
VESCFVVSLLGLFGERHSSRTGKEN